MTQVTNNFADKYAKSKTVTLQKLAKVKKGEELEAIQAILKNRGAAAEGQTVYENPEPLPAEDAATLEAAEKNEGKAPAKAKKEKKAKEPKAPRELKKQKTDEEVAAAKADAEKNIGRLITFWNKKTQSELTGTIQSVRLDPRSNLLQYIIKVPGETSIRGKAIDQKDFTIGELAPVEAKPEKPAKEKKSPKVKKGDTPVDTTEVLAGAPETDDLA